MSIFNRTFVEDPKIKVKDPVFIYYDPVTYETFWVNFASETATQLSVLADKPKDSILSTQYAEDFLIAPLRIENCLQQA